MKHDESGKKEPQWESNTEGHKESGVIGLYDDETHIQRLLKKHIVEKNIKKKNVQYHITSPTDRIPECLKGKYFPERRIEKIYKIEDVLSHARCNIKIKFPALCPGNNKLLKCIRETHT